MEQIDDLLQGTIDREQKDSEQLSIKRICETVGAESPDEPMCEAEPKDLQDYEVEELVRLGDDESGATSSKEFEGVQITKKKRGRPRKHPIGSKPDAKDTKPKERPRKKRSGAQAKAKQKGKPDAKGRQKAQPKRKPNKKAQVQRKARKKIQEPGSRKARARLNLGEFELQHDRDGGIALEP